MLGKELAMNAVITMADEKKSGKDAGKKPAYTTFRIFEKDGENLSELADKRRMSVAKLYHELFSETVRKMLLEEVRRRQQELEGRK